MVRKGVRFNDVCDIKDIIVCGVDSHQMQSSYLLIDGEIHYCVMNVKGSTDEMSKSTHNNKINDMKNLIDNKEFNLYDLRYLENRGVPWYVIQHMKEYQRVFNREYKINQVLSKEVGGT